MTQKDHIAQQHSDLPTIDWNETKKVRKPSWSENSDSDCPFVSVVIPTYKREEVLIDTIDYVLANTYPSFEVIVVDQTPKHSPPVSESLERLKENQRFRHVKLETSSLPLARNTGLEVASGEIIIYCDDDVVVSEDYIRQHVNMYTSQRIGAVAGRIKNARPDQKPPQRPTTERPPGQISENGWAEPYFNQDYEGDVDFGQGCNMSFRSDVLSKLGGFDERFTKTAIYEEVDVFVRLQKAGYRAVFAKEATVLHLSPPTGGCRSQKEEIDRYRSGYRNLLLYSLKNYPVSMFVSFAWNQMRTAYSACRINKYSPLSFFRIISGFPEALWAAGMQSDHRLSRSVSSVQKSQESVAP